MSTHTPVSIIDLAGLDLAPAAIDGCTVEHTARLSTPSRASP
jgi:hypothetical protein